MEQIRQTYPAEFFWGEDALFELSNRAAAHGRRVLLITEGSYSERGLAGRVQDMIERRGLNCLVFDEVVRTDPVVSIDEALKVARGSHATAIAGVGGGHTLAMARAAAGIVESRADARSLFAPGAGEGVSEGVLEGADGGPETGVPFYSVPVSGRHPWMFRSEGCFWDPYNSGAAAVFRLPAELEGGCFLDLALMDSLPEKYRIFLFLEEILTSVEGFLAGSGTFFSRNLFHSALERRVPLLHGNFRRLAERQGRQAGLEGAVFNGWGCSLLGAGPLLLFAYAAGDQWRVPRSAVAAMLLPALLESRFAGQSPLRGELEACLTAPGEKPSGLVDLAEVVRSWMTAADLPLRFRDLHLKMDQLSTTIDRLKEHPLFRAGSSGMTPSDLFELVRNGY